jgi:vancomycin permeability regulator SanA
MKLRSTWQRTLAKLSRKSAAVITIGFACIIGLITVFSWLYIERFDGFTYTKLENAKILELDDVVRTAIVFGGGINVNLEPLPLLRDRLDTGHQLYSSGSVDKLLVSGDNRFLDYNEPMAMKLYLQKKGVPEEDIIVDYAGRSTFETCERAIKIFGITRAFLVSETTHLPRAIFLCRHFGIEAFGYASNGESASGLLIGQRWREVLARNKAMFNAYIVGERTVLGEKIITN